MLEIFWLLPLATLFQEGECSEKKWIRGNKKGQVPETSKKEKSETRGKNGQVSDSRIRGTRYPPERKEKWNIQRLISLKSFKCKKGMYPHKRAKVELDFHHYFHHYHHSFATHVQLDLTYWLVFLDPWFSYHPPMSFRYELQIHSTFALLRGTYLSCTWSFWGEWDALYFIFIFSQVGILYP